MTIVNVRDCGKRERRRERGVKSERSAGMILSLLDAFQNCRSGGL